MALDTFPAAFVSFAVDAQQLATSAVGIFEPGVTPEAHLPGRIERQEFPVVRMIDRRAVAVFTFDVLMTGVIERNEIFLVTLLAVLPALVLDREIFPFLDIAEAMEAVGKVLAMHAEVIRNQECPGDEYHPYESNGYP